MAIGRQLAKAGLATVVAGVLAAPSWAGQINLSARSTVTSETITTSASGSLSETLSGTGTITRVGQDAIQETIIRSIVVTETFLPTTAAVSVEVSQDGIDYSSPFENELAVGSITQSVTATGTAGLTNVQGSAGAANVSVASNALIDGGTLTSIVGPSGVGGSITPMAGQVAAMALTAGFALQNSNANAVALIAANAVAGAVASDIAGNGGARTAVDIQQVDLAEYSPHHNTVATASLGQTVLADGTVGINNVQGQVGVANVQAAHTLMVFGADTIGDLPAVLGQ